MEFFFLAVIAAVILFINYEFAQLVKAHVPYSVGYFVFGWFLLSWPLFALAYIILKVSGHI